MLWTDSSVITIFIICVTILVKHFFEGTSSEREAEGKIRFQQERAEFYQDQLRDVNEKYHQVLQKKKEQS